MFDLISRVEQKVKVRVKDKTVEVRRWKCKNKYGEFMLYANDASYMYTTIWGAEAQRVNDFIRKKWPGQKSLIQVDNAPMHQLYTEYSNITYMFLPKNSTAKLQACDILYNACIKAKYKKSIARVLWDMPDDKKRVFKEGTAVELIMKSIKETSQVFE